MKKFYALSLTLFACAISFGQTTLPNYEPFNYTAPGVLQTQYGWAAINSGDDIVVASGNLSYTGIPASTGNKITFGGIGIDAQRAFTSVTTGTVYYSFLLTIPSMAGVTDVNGGYISHFIQGGTTYGATLWTKRVDDNNLNFGIEVKTATGASTSWTAASYPTGQTYLVVVGYTFNTGTTNDDTVNLWVNPTVGGAEPTATLSDTHTGTDLTGIASFAFRQDSATETPAALEIDELRIATTWTDVTQNTSILGVNQNNIAGLKVYPNPVTDGKLFISTDLNTEKNVTIFDALGKQVLNTTVENGMVNTSALHTGVYIVKITEEGKTATRKLVIK